VSLADSAAFGLFISGYIIGLTGPNTHSVRQFAKTQVSHEVTADKIILGDLRDLQLLSTPLPKTNVT